VTQPLGAILTILAIWLYAFDRSNEFMPWVGLAGGGLVIRIALRMMLVAPFSRGVSLASWPGRLNWWSGFFVFSRLESPYAPRRCNIIRRLLTCLGMEWLLFLAPLWCWAVF
jgi:hypothetical protein